LSEISLIWDEDAQNAGKKVVLGASERNRRSYFAMLPGRPAQVKSSVYPEVRCTEPSGKPGNPAISNTSLSGLADYLLPFALFFRLGKCFPYCPNLAIF
jgi:hypothetical protein